MSIFMRYNDKALPTRIATRATMTVMGCRRAKTMGFIGEETLVFLWQHRAVCSQPLPRQRASQASEPGHQKAQPARRDGPGKAEYPAVSAWQRAGQYLAPAHSG